MTTEFDRSSLRSDHHVVIVDNYELGYLTGAIVGIEQVRALEPKGLITLPVDRAVVSMNGLAGWNKRSFGGGVSMHSTSARKIPGECALFIQPMQNAATYIHWAAEVVSDDDQALSADGANISLQMATQPTFGSASLGNVMRRPFETRREVSSSWILRGCVEATVIHHGPAMFSLYGMIRFARLQWLALSQAPTP